MWNGEPGFVAGKQVLRAGSLLMKRRPQHSLQSWTDHSNARGTERLYLHSIEELQLAIYDTIRVTDAADSNRQETEDHLKDVE